MNIQEIILNLKKYWISKKCIILEPIDIEVGAGTFHPATFLYALDNKKWNICYVQPCRRPKDGRYLKSFNRLQYYFQFQTILKPSPNNLQELYINSLKNLGINFKKNDINFIEDNWESPTLGAWGLGWEVWLNGIEISQITYFQQIGGINCKPILSEITYGLERIAMNLQKVNDVSNTVWGLIDDKKITYKDLYSLNEIEQCKFNFKNANFKFLEKQFLEFENECIYLIKEGLLYPAYEKILKISHIFNILEARVNLFHEKRKSYILRIRKLSCFIAKEYKKKFD